MGVPQIWARWAIVTGPFLLFEEATGLVLAVYDVEGDEIEFSLG